ncbi:hypothetical protein BpHYR1_035019 [Brachionus plicatilis]|uniref:Uncharacterized protein n=1 Tax=Brachionus plicatilis TaxID=10195 RepID=A0A3M7SK57_BRAPC|nr:hypothetical protein BpHYR1_035019 [Brachionus plicatilis]
MWNSESTKNLNLAKNQVSYKKNLHTLVFLKKKTLFQFEFYQILLKLSKIILGRILVQFVFEIYNAVLFRNEMTYLGDEKFLL